MKNIFKVVIASVLAFALVGCDDTKTVDLSNNAEVQAQLQGEVLGDMTPATKVRAMGVKLNDETSQIIMVMKAKGQNPQGFILTALHDLDLIGVAHSFYVDGKLLEDAGDISIVRYPAGSTKFTEGGEERGLIFASSNGDTDIVKVLKGIADKGDDSVYVIEADVTDGDLVTAHSYTFTGKQFKEATAKVDWSIMGTATVPADEEFVSAFTTEDLEASVKG